MSRRLKLGVWYLTNLWHHWETDPLNHIGNL